MADQPPGSKSTRAGGSAQIPDLIGWGLVCLDLCVQAHGGCCRVTFICPVGANRQDTGLGVSESLRLGVHRDSF